MSRRRPTHDPFYIPIHIPICLLLAGLACEAADPGQGAGGDARIPDADVAPDVASDQALDGAPGDAARPMDAAILDRGPVDARAPDAQPLDAALEDAAPIVDAATRPDAAPERPQIDCAAVCTLFDDRCAQSRWVFGDCGPRCAPLALLASRLDRPRMQRSVALCAEAVARQHCHHLSACLSDDDGLLAVGDGFEVEVILPDGAALRVADAVVVVGAKGDGGPSDLEAFFTVDETFYALVFDDLARAEAPGRVSAQAHPVTLLAAELGAWTHPVGAVDLARLALPDETGPGGVELSAEVRRSAAEPALRVTVHGSFRAVQGR